MFGLLDVASDMNIERHREDFGQTLGRWGVPAGPYVVLPLLGPSTLRDTAALPVDRFGDPVVRSDDTCAQFAPARAAHDRHAPQYLRAAACSDEAALDKYSFTRDAFLQRRRSQVYDGNPPDDGAGNSPADDGAESK
jgi:phospholipid-binding lipoprotein MlaA